MKFSFVKLFDGFYNIGCCKSNMLNTKGSKTGLLDDVTMDRDGKTTPKRHITMFVFLCWLVPATGGLLFGYDIGSTGVIVLTLAVRFPPSFRFGLGGTLPGLWTTVHGVRVTGVRLEAGGGGDG